MTTNINPTTILQVTLGDLRTIINEVITEARQATLAEMAAANEVATLSRDEAAKHLRVATSTIDRWTAQGLLPSYKVGVRVLFKRSDLDKLLVTRKA